MYCDGYRNYWWTVTHGITQMGRIIGLENLVFLMIRGSNSFCEKQMIRY